MLLNAGPKTDVGLGLELLDLWWDFNCSCDSLSEDILFGHVNGRTSMTNSAGYTRTWRICKWLFVMDLKMWLIRV